MAAELWRELSESLLVCTAALLLIAALRKPVRRRFGARAAYALWLLLPLTAMAALLPAPATPAPAVGVLAGALRIGEAAAGGEPAPLFDPLPWLLSWAAGAAFGLLWTIRQQLRFVRDLGELQPAGDGSHRSRRVQVPALVGLLRPRIVLPADFEQRYSPTEQALVLAHERAHLRHGDAWANAAAALAACLLWCHPLAWWALRRFRFDQELACDARVLDHAPDARRSYAQALLKTQLSADAAWRLPLGCHWQSCHPLTERIAMLKATLPDRPHRLAGRLCVLALCCTAAFAAWAAQPPATAAVKAGQAGFDIVQPESRNPEDPILQEATRPRYPKAALEQQLSGKLMLHVQIDSEGRVIDVVVDHAEPAGVFDAATIEAVRSWRFQPGIKDGQPVGGWVQVPVSFEPERSGAE